MLAAGRLPGGVIRKAGRRLFGTIKEPPVKNYFPNKHKQLFRVLCPGVNTDLPSGASLTKNFKVFKQTNDDVFSEGPLSDVIDTAVSSLIVKPNAGTSILESSFKKEQTDALKFSAFMMYLSKCQLLQADDYPFEEFVKALSFMSTVPVTTLVSSVSLVKLGGFGLLVDGSVDSRENPTFRFVSDTDELTARLSSPEYREATTSIRFEYRPNSDEFYFNSNQYAPLSYGISPRIRPSDMSFINSAFKELGLDGKLSLDNPEVRALFLRIMATSTTVRSSSSAVVMGFNDATNEGPPFQTLENLFFKAFHSAIYSDNGTLVHSVSLPVLYSGNIQWMGIFDTRGVVPKFSAFTNGSPVQISQATKLID